MTVVPASPAASKDFDLITGEGTSSYPTGEANDPTANKSRSVLVASGLALTGLLSGTGTTVPLAEPTVRYIGEWTSTARLVGYDPAGSAFLRLAMPLLPAVAEPPPVDPRASDVTALEAVSDRATQAVEVKWLHEASGLTWEQLGRLFGVSRRSVHLWANGSRMNSANAELLGQLVAHVRELPGGPDERRVALLSPSADGLSFVDQMRARNRSGLQDITGSAFRPDELLGARHDEGENGPSSS